MQLVALFEICYRPRQFATKVDKAIKRRRLLPKYQNLIQHILEPLTLAVFISI